MKKFFTFGGKIIRSCLQKALALHRAEVAILMYHRVYKASSDPQLLCVTPEHFSEHMDYLSRSYSVISLSKLVQNLLEGNLPKRAVAITFDDGYFDNFLYAKKILMQFSNPATIFVTTGNYGKEFWWDELERLILWQSRLPGQLQVKFAGQILCWELGKWAVLKEKKSLQKWNVEFKTDSSSRQGIYRKLYSTLRTLEKKQREELLDQLRSFSKEALEKQRECRAMNPDEIQQLFNKDLIDIGAHTVTHPVLSLQSLEEQKKEIFQSKYDLEEILGCTITSFSYPFGSKNDTGNYSVKLAKEAGYKVACANFPEPVTYRSNPFFLPRYIVRDWDGDIFARKLRGFFYD